MYGALAAGGALVALFASALPNQLTDPPYFADAPEDGMVIELVSVYGSGCPEGSAAVAVSPDNTAFTVTYSEYLAQVGVGAKPTDFRKNCQLNLAVRVPQGFTYAVFGVDYRDTPIWRTARPVLSKPATTSRAPPRPPPPCTPSTDR
ncbi:hypothetical protein GCM10009716_30030 [Streptomyces sodiiphilus]|uniref:DUF4360 domain-containing protein n=1 Tax=Streptomyces sodiiphilus TaxID=226217 RepID=A0ABN2PH61_9ACTN